MKIISGLIFVLLFIALIWFVIRSVIDLVHELKKRKLNSNLKDNERYHSNDKDNESGTN